MIAFVTMGSRDRQAAIAYYDALFAELGAEKVFSEGDVACWGMPQGGPLVSVGLPFSVARAGAGNETAVVLRAESVDMVDRLYRAALALGGSNQVAPSWHATSYAGFVCDVDGNSLGFVYSA